MKILKLSIFLTLCILAGACKQRDIILFSESQQGIYFQTGDRSSPYNNTEVYTDSINFSFSESKASLRDTTLYVRLRTLGNVEPFDRKVNLAIVADSSSAIKGIDYEANFENVVIPAGSSELAIGIKFYRTVELLTQKRQLLLKLQDNDYFKVLFDKQKNTNVYSSVGDSISASHFRFVVSEFYSRPSYWNFVDGTNGRNYQYFGNWSVTKFRLVNEIMGWTPEDWKNGGQAASPVKLGRFPVAALTIRNYLQALADVGTPVLDDDDKPMQLGALYLVAY
jgi:hypothetical protein